MFEDLFKKLENTKYFKTELTALTELDNMVNDYLKAGKYLKAWNVVQDMIDYIYSRNTYINWLYECNHTLGDQCFPGSELEILDSIRVDLERWRDSAINDVFGLPCVRSYFEEKCGIKEAKNE